MVVARAVAVKVCSVDANAVSSALQIGGDTPMPCCTAIAWIYVVRWPADGSPSEPELVFHHDGYFEALIAQP